MTSPVVSDENDVNLLHFVPFAWESSKLRAYKTTLDLERIYTATALAKANMKPKMRLVLFEIAQNLEPDEVEQAKYYFGDKIGNQKREKIKNAFHLLTILEQLMPNSIIEELKRFLTHIGRNDILQDNKASAGAYEMPRIPIQVVRQNSGHAAAAPKSGGAAPQASDTKKTTSKDLFPGSLGKSNQGIDIEKVCDLDLISRAAASVCSIDTYGTGFRVGDKCIMTAAHVLKDALEIQDREMQHIWDMDSGERSSFFKRCVQNKLNLSVLRARFTHRQDCYYKLTTLRYVDVYLDTAVVELAPTDGNPFPQAFTRFRGGHKGRFSLIGHVGDRKLYREHNCYTITERKDFQRMKIELGNKGIPPKHLEVYDTFGKDSSFLQFHCSLRQGASGSPGVVVHDGEVRVVTMLQAGYPGNPSNIHIDDRLCVEQGVTMAAIYEHMGMTDKQLHEDIFGPD